MRLTLSILLLAATANAATYCVGPSASGSGSGADWSNQKAWTDTPARGDTWYLRSSSTTNYAAKTLAVAGTTLITIKKATTNDHVTATGWSDWMGGQAVIQSPMIFQSSYYLLDGVERDESNWENAASYGIRLNDNGNVQIDQRGVATCDNITVQYVHLKGINTSPGGGGDIGRRHIFLDDQIPGSITGWTIRRCFFQYGNVGIQVRRTSSFLVEYCMFADNWSSQPNNHGENVSAYYEGNNGHIYRYNQSRNMIGTAAWAVNTANNWEVYGNVYADCTYGDGFIGFIGGSSANFKIYNETIIRPQVYTRQVSLGSGSVVQNCLFMMGALGTPTFTGATLSYNGFSGSGSGTSTQTSIPTSIFVDYGGGNYQLTTDTVAGITLSAPYNEDMLGTTRGIQGGWSRGAFQYFTNAPAVSTIGGNLIINGNVIIGQ